MYFPFILHCSVLYDVIPYLHDMGPERKQLNLIFIGIKFFLMYRTIKVDAYVMTL